MHSRAATATRTARDGAAAWVARDARPRAPLDTEVRELVTSAGRAPREVISLWPADRRRRLVVSIRRDEGRQVQVRAWIRGGDLDAPNAARIRAIRGDVAVVVELDSGRTVIVPWRSLESALT